MISVGQWFAQGDLVERLFRGNRYRARLSLATVTLCVAMTQAIALDRVDLSVADAPGLNDRLRGASLVLQAQRDGRTDAQDLFASAQADYSRLLGALYAEGHYSGTISIRIDGREAAGIPPLDPPLTISTITYSVTAGPQFRFGRAEIGPVSKGTVLPEGFAPGQPAFSGVIRQSAERAVTGWREAGHPKAAIGAQALIANHPRQLLDAGIEVLPGPRATFGNMRFQGHERMREERLRAIAGFPTGEVFSPEALRKSADRLRRTRVFRSVAMAEAETLGPGDTLDVTTTLLEEAPRRIGFGGELASLDGLTLTAFWLHRNLFGGAERLRVEAEIAQIGASETGIDYAFGVTFERPATFTPDTTFTALAQAAYINDADQTLRRAELGAGLTHIFNDTLSGRAGIALRVLEGSDSGGNFAFQNLSAPIGVLWDRRDNRFDATAGTYLDAEIMPYLGFGTTNSGARLKLDARAYRALGSRVVLAGRVQAGAVFGDGLLRTPRDYLFYSGGGGTVRGQPFQALGVNILRGGAQRTGGMRFLGGSAEVRARITDNIGAVAFYDVGHVGAIEFFDSASNWHAGAGVGLRYATPIGPIRLDVAAPAGGGTGRGVQVYLGIGQAF